MARGKHNYLWRHLAELALDTLLFRGFVARICYRIGLHGEPSCVQYEVPIPNDRGLKAPLRVAFLSDFHAGPTSCPLVFHEAFEMIASQKISLLLLGGDFISCRASYIQDLLPLIEKAHAPLGKFAVLGNHDLWSDHDYITRQLERVGVTVLVNENQTLPEPFSMISVCGTDDPWTGEVDIASCFAGSAPTRLLLTHAPDGLMYLKNEQFDVAFAGHTHGGQIATNSGKPLFLPHGKLSRIYPYGLFKQNNPAYLIVSRGLGCSNFPIRINAAPELVICDLVPTR